MVLRAHYGKNVDQASYVNAITSNLSSTYALGLDGKSLILDTGATDSVFHDREHFAEYTQGVSLARSFVYTADGKPHTAEGTGVVPIKVNNGESSFIVNLQALHVPSLNTTLVSVIRLNESGDIEFKLGKGGVPSLTRDGVKWADVHRHRSGLILLFGHVITLPNRQSQRANLSTGMLWHNRLGHPGNQLMQELAARGDIHRLS